MANRVVILGIDGAGGFIQNADAPHIHTLLKAGAYSYDAQTVYPSISAECWGSLLYGVKPDRHVLDNDRAIHGRIPEDFPMPRCSSWLAGNGRMPLVCIQLLGTDQHGNH